jgi:hypothetical protein
MIFYYIDSTSETQQCYRLEYPNFFQILFFRAARGPIYLFNLFARFRFFLELDFELVLWVFDLRWSTLFCVFFVLLLRHTFARRWVWLSPKDAVLYATLALS